MHTHTRTSVRARRGLALVSVCAVIFLVLGAVIAMGTVSSQNLCQVTLSVYEKQAIYVAEAGLQDALLQLKTGSTWGAGGPAVIPAGFDHKAMPGPSGFSYTVTVTNNHAGGQPVASDGTQVNLGCVYLRSSGTATQGVTRTVSAVARQGVFGVWKNAVFGDQWVHVNGNPTIDSYDSAAGPYTPAPSPQGNAYVGTNGSSAGVIGMGGSSLVDGSLLVGPGANPTTAVTGATHATGEVFVASAPTALPVVSPSPVPTGPFVNQAFTKKNSGAGVSLPPGDYGSLSMGSQAVVNLTAGRYYFAGNVDIGAGSRLTITSGPVEIFFAGSWSSGANTIVNAIGSSTNGVGLPSNLRIYGTSTATTVTLDGGTQTSLLMYAPTAALTFVGTADLYGSVVAGTVDLRGTSGIHYDQQGRNAGFDLTNLGPWTLTGLHRW